MPQYTIRHVRIFDILVLTTLFAFLFAMQDLTDKTQGLLIPSKAPWNWLFRGQYALVWGLSTWGTYLCVRLWRESKLVLQPGHLLLGFSAIACSLNILNGLIESFLVQESSTNEFSVRPSDFGATLWFLGHAASALLPITALLPSLKKQYNFGRWWRAVILLLFGAQVFFAVGVAGLLFPVQAILAVFVVSRFGLMLAMLSIFVCATRDLILRDSRDWLHWMGVFVTLFQAIAPTAMFAIASYFLTSSELMGR